jgi:dienelactone hydrolase
MHDFEQFIHSHDGMTHEVFKKGNGPAILVMHELPGMITECVDFADRLIKEGFTVYLPLLFGEPDIQATILETINSISRLCISKEFYIFSSNRTSPIVEWLRSLCRLAHKECGYVGVGAIGMCLTGGFAIPLMVEPSLMAPVLSQPSLPMNPLDRASMGCSEDDFQFACLRSKKEKIPVLGFKFSNDILSSNDKFQLLKFNLGELFIDSTIDSSLGNQYNIPFHSHSVFTVHYNDSTGHPTRVAFEKLVKFYKERLIEK